MNEKGIYNIPYKIRDEVAKQIPSIQTLDDIGEYQDKERSLKEVLSTSPILTKYYKEFPLWFELVMDLEGLPKSKGKHAGGILVTPKPLTEYVPMCTDKDGEPMVQLEMYNAMDDLGLVKYDLLGLKTLDVVYDTIKMIGKEWNDFDINHMDLDDKNVLKNIYEKGNTFNVFQFESYECIDMCKQIEFESIHDVVAINAFNRPGTKGQFPMYVKNKANVDNMTILHEDLREIFDISYGVLLYQEQVLKILALAGLDESEQDKGRRAMGKKKEKEMQKLKPKIIKGLKKINWSDEKIEELWELLIEQSKYNFNLGHALAYSLMSYLTAYLKYYYPLEFMTSCLNNEDNYGKMSKIITEIRKLNIKLLPPKMNKSREYFTVDKENNSILYGVYPIKSVGEKAGFQIIENESYKDFKDFYNKNVTTGSKVNIATLVMLIKSGYFGTSKKDKFNTFKELFDSEFMKRNSNKINAKYKPKKTVGMSLKKLKEEFNIEEKDKEKRLELYNKAMEEKFYRDKKINMQKLKEKYKKERLEFKEKYMLNPKMWEFEALSMFVSYNPLSESTKYIKKTFVDYSLNSPKSICIGSIIKIDKKGKGSKQNAFVDIYTSDDIIVEAIMWSNVYKKYANMIKRGETIIIKGHKEADDKIVASEVKLYEDWLLDKKEKYDKINKSKKNPKVKILKMR